MDRVERSLRRRAAGEARGIAPIDRVILRYNDGKGKELINDAATLERAARFFEKEGARSFDDVAKYGLADDFIEALQLQEKRVTVAKLHDELRALARKGEGLIARVERLRARRQARCLHGEQARRRARQQQRRLVLVWEDVLASLLELPYSRFLRLESRF